MICRIGALLHCSSALLKQPITLDAAVKYSQSYLSQLVVNDLVCVLACCAMSAFCPSFIAYTRVSGCQAEEELETKCWRTFHRAGQSVHKCVSKINGLAIQHCTLLSSVH